LDPKVAAAAAALKGKNCTVQIAPAPLFYDQEH
jgi:hypothetical protein